ncbi:MAG: hypothetical protein II256_00915 [Bacteroidales bacterium]|nr:hypothetical protein [Bacteroidales bacterium]
MFETIKKLFKKEEKVDYDQIKIEEAQKKEEYTEARNETGKLIGFFGPAGFEKVDDQYELREMLHEVLERLDRIESVLNIEKGTKK